MGRKLRQDKEGRGVPKRREGSFSLAQGRIAASVPPRAAGAQSDIAY